MQFMIYHISLVARWIFSFQNNPKNLDPSYNMDLYIALELFRKGKLGITAQFH